MFPSQIIGWAFPNEVWARNLSVVLGGGGSGIVFYSLTGLMIFFFSYFWVATMFQPNQIADDLKKWWIHPWCSAWETDCRIFGLDDESAHLCGSDFLDDRCCVASDSD